jgi:hypothetical protein
VSERTQREEALARDLAKVNCDLARSVGEDDRYFVLNRWQMSVYTLDEAEEWCREELARWVAAGA